jgi:hypothetical protein
MNNKSTPEGFCTKDELWCAIPYGDNQYIIIHNGEQVHLCRSLDTAKKFIRTKNKLCM